MRCQTADAGSSAGWCCLAARIGQAAVSRALVGMSSRLRPAGSGRTSRGETISIDLLIDGVRPVLQKPAQTLPEVVIGPQPASERQFRIYAGVAAA
jgi:hypothetical protein